MTAAAKAERFSATNLWNGDVTLGGGAGQTELKVSKATSEEIRSWSSAVEADFPGGHQQIGPHLQPGLTWYRWRYTEPGQGHRHGVRGPGARQPPLGVDPEPWRALES